MFSGFIRLFFLLALGPIVGLIVGFLAMPLAFSGASLAQTADPAQESVQEPARELDALKGEIRASTIRQAELVKAMADAIRIQEDASAKLVALAETAAQQEQRVAKAEQRIGELNRDNAKALLALAEKRDAMSKLLAGLQRLEQNPPPALAVAPNDVLQALRGAMMFGAVVPQLRRETAALRTALADVEAIRTDLESEKLQAVASLADLEKTRAEIGRIVDEKQAAAAKDAETLAMERNRRADLAGRATSLKDLIARLEQARKADMARRKAEEEARVLAEADAAARAQALAEKQRLSAPFQPKIAFAKTQGELDYPALGQVVRHFGDSNGLGGTLQGLLISTARKAQVLAPVEGRIEFAGQFRSYDQLLIINPGDGYLVLLAGMDEITAEPGQSVRAGEPVGHMGEKQSALALATGLPQGDGPMLYVEFRKKNDPVDPSPWWKDRRKEAMR